MAIGSLDRTPPPFFRQGPSALSKLAFFASLALFLMVADTRLHLAGPVRNALSVLLLPLQRVAALPIDALQNGGFYLHELREAQLGAQEAAQRLAALSERAARTEVLARENQRLRALLELRPALKVPGIAAEVLYESADPYSRKVVIDRGSQQGVLAGSPVINESGVVGQVTRVYLLGAEVTLLVDKDSSISVLNTRSQQRSVAFGANAGMELRFTSPDADVQNDDPLVTSGLDGVFPAGLAVGQVGQVSKRGDSGFARILVTPAALPAGVRHVLVLTPLSQLLPPRPGPSDAEASADAASAAKPSERSPTSGKQGRKKAGTEAPP